MDPRICGTLVLLFTEASGCAPDPASPPSSTAAVLPTAPATLPTVSAAVPTAASSPPSLVSAPPKPTSAAVASPAAPPARPQCDPSDFAKERLGAGGVVDPSGVTSLQDLDGDGRIEVAVSYLTNDQDASQQPRLMLLSPTGASNCFQVSYDGVGSQVSLRTTKTKGAYDLELAITYGAGGMLMNLNGDVLLKSDGTRYRWAQVLKCDLWSAHQQQSPARCRSEIQSLNPDKR